MQCVVCSSPHTIESHHMRLQAEGGESSTEVPLCATCHKLAHLQARALQSKNKKTREKNYIPATLAKKMGIVVQAILSGALKFEIEKEKFQNVAMQNIQIPVEKTLQSFQPRSILDASNYKAYKFASYGQRRQLLENLGNLTRKYHGPMI